MSDIEITTTAATYTESESVGITAKARNCFKAVRVTFYANGVPIGTKDYAKPWVRTLKSMLPGTYDLTAVGMDAKGKTQSSNLLTVTVTAVTPTSASASVSASPSASVSPSPSPSSSRSASPSPSPSPSASASPSASVSRSPSASPSPSSSVSRSPSASPSPSHSISSSPSPSVPEASETLSSADFDYLGSYVIPTPSVGSMAGTSAMGLALRYEPSDATNPVHLITTAYRPTQVASNHRIKLEMRGAAIKLWVDEGSGYGANPVAAATDTAITAAGKAGLIVGTALDYALDNFAATNAGGGAFATDTFTASNGTALAGRTLSGGGTWVRASSSTSNIEIQGNTARLVSGATGNAYYYATGAPSSADYDVEADLSPIAVTGGSTGVMGRATTAADAMYFAYYFTNGQGNFWVLAKFVGGVYTELGRGASPKGGTGYMAHTYEWRDQAPTNPSNPTLSTSYSWATIVKEWGNIFGPGPSTRTTIHNGAMADLSDGLAGTQREGGLGWDSVNNVLYWTFTETYSNDDTACGIGYTALDYATGAVTAYGPWQTAATRHKGTTSGVVELPAAFVSAVGLGTQRLAAVGKRPASLAASGDASTGPALTSFVPPVGVTPQSLITSTRLVGYAPTSTVSGPLRPASIQWFQGTGSRAVIPYSAFPENTWNIYDSTFGGVFIHGATKSGFVSIQRLWKGQATYVHAHNTVEMIVTAMSIVSEADLAEVALGTATPQSIQPVTTELTWPVLDPVDYQSVQYATIATITSVAGQRRSGQDASGSPDQNAILTTTTPHGLGPAGTSLVFGVQGNSGTEYNDNWEATVIDATRIGIHNASLDSYVWSGATGIGGTIRSTDSGLEDYNGVRILGCAFDANTNKFYLGYRHKDGTPMVSVWAVNC